MPCFGTQWLCLIPVTGRGGEKAGVGEKEVVASRTFSVSECPLSYGRLINTVWIGYKAA